MELEYGQRYRELYEKHWWWRAREAAVLGLLRRQLSCRSPLAILDVGCGDALFFDKLAAFGDVEGIEPAAALVNPSGPHRSRIHIVPFDGNFRPEKQFDLILMLDVLEHLPEPVAALRHAATLLAPDGVLLLTLPAFAALWTSHDALNHHLRRYTVPMLRQQATEAGLRLQTEQYLFQWTFPAKLLIRGVEALFPAPPAPPRIPAPAINRALYWLSRLEQQTIGRLDMPFGSTLLATCRKPPLTHIPENRWRD